MIYELRKWFDAEYCLFTDDRRLRDYVARQKDIQIVGRYYADAVSGHISGAQPVAWDICGNKDDLDRIAHQFSNTSAVRTRVA